METHYVLCEVRNKYIHCVSFIGVLITAAATAYHSGCRLSVRWSCLARCRYKMPSRTRSVQLSKSFRGWCL